MALILRYLTDFEFKVVEDISATIMLTEESSF